MESEARGAPGATGAETFRSAGSSDSVEGVSRAMRLWYTRTGEAI